MIPRTQTGSRYELMLEHRHWASSRVAISTGCRSSSQPSRSTAVRQGCASMS